MAEGGNMSRTLEGGSESLFDHECVQCRTQGYRQEAIDVCRDCKQHLCNTCGRYHIRNMTTHTLVSLASMSQTKPAQPPIGPAPVVAKCLIHPDLDIEMHCGTHDMVYCCRCIAKEHRLCSDVKDIEDVAHKSNMSTLQALVADITRVSTKLHATKLEKSNDLKQLKKKKASLLDEIKALRKKFNKQLDALERNIIAELDKEEKRLKQDISDDITTVDDLIVASDKTKPDLTSQLDRRQIFITEKLGRAILGDASTFLKKHNKVKHSTLKFEPNAALCDLIATSDCIGKITRITSSSNIVPTPGPIGVTTVPPRKQRSNYTLKSTNEINVRVKSDKEECWIPQMCRLTDGTILLIDGGNNKLKRLDDQLKVKDFLTFKASPSGLCSLSHNEVAVRLSNDTVNWIHVGKSMSIQQTVSINHTSEFSRGMVSCSSQLWILGESTLYIYSLSGTLVKTIETDDAAGQRIYYGFIPTGIAVNNDETKVYVAASKSVVVFNKNGDVVNKFSDQRLRGACAVCITHDDIILVAGDISRNVVMFDRDGNCLGELVPLTSNPKTLCYDRQKCRLLVHIHYNTLEVFQLT